MRVDGWLKVPHSVNQPRAVLIGLVAFLVVVLPLSWALHMRDRYHRTLGGAEENLTLTSRLLEADVRIAVHATNLALGMLLERYRDDGATEEGAAREGLQAEANELRQGLPMVAGLWLVGPRGDVVAGSSAGGAPEAVGRLAEVMAREHPDGGDGMEIGGAVPQLGKNRWIFTVGRRLQLGGSVAAFALAAIDGTQLMQAPGDGRPAPHKVGALFRDDGMVLVPPPEEVRPGQGLVAAAAFQRSESSPPSGSFQGVVAAGRRKHIVAFRRVAGLPLAVCASMPLDEALAGWRSDLNLGAGVLVVSLVTLGGLAMVTWRRIRDQEEARLQLAMANRALEERVRQRTRELEAARDAAERAALMRSKFLSMASHDLRQPVQAMKSFHAVLDGSATEPRMIRALAQLGAALSSLEVLLDSVMNLSSLESGGMQAEIMDFPVDEILTDVAAQLEQLAGNKGLVYRQVPCHCMVRSDPVLLSRILRNLTMNALRYTRQGKVLLGCRHKGSVLSIEVWDTGPGIPEDKLAKIFDEFVRLRGQADPGGLGLGLSIVAKAATLLGHPVKVRSRLGQGSVFAVEVPLTARYSTAMRDPV